MRNGSSPHAASVKMLAKRRSKVFFIVFENEGWLKNLRDARLEKGCHRLKMGRMRLAIIFRV